MWGAGLGLIGLLIVVGLVLYLEASADKPAIEAGEKAKTEIRQYGGIDANGGKSIDSAKLEGLNEGGKIKGLLVDSVTPDGSYATYFDLKKDDTITAVEYQGFKRKVSEFTNEDEARSEVDEAYRHKGHVFVSRDDKELELPSGTPGAPQPAHHGGDPLQNQLDAIQSAGGTR